MPKRSAHDLLRRAVTVWSVVALLAHSDAGVAFPLSMLIIGTLLVLLVGWLLAVAAAVSTARPPDRTRADALRGWVGLPLPILVTIALIWLAVPVSVRLFLSGPALQQSGPYLASLPPSHFQERPPWVGLFRVREFKQYDDELRFLTSACGLVDNCGLVFSPGRRPPNRGEDSFEHLYGDWWLWYQSW